MQGRVEVGLHLSLSALLVGVIAIAVALEGGAPPLRAAGLALFCLLAALVGGALVVRAGPSTPRPAPRPAARAALGGLAWSPAAAGALLLFEPEAWPMALILPLALPAGAAVAAGLWGLLPGWLQRALQWFA